MNIILHCTICQEPLSETRARRQTAVCSERCKNKLDSLRAEQRATRKCPHCLHPSSPGERAQFRAWRACRGDVKNETPLKRDMTWPPKNELRVALKRAIAFLRVHRDLIAGPALDEAAWERVEGAELTDMNELIPEFERLVDTKGEEEVTLAPSGIAAQEIDDGAS